MDSLLKIAPFIVETDSMSVKHIRTLKTMKGDYVCWLEIIEEFTFAIIHAKVVVEDCISIEPQHLPEPMEEDHQLERDYKSDLELGKDLENLVKKKASLAQREETIWQIEQLHRSSRVIKPTKRMEHYCLQQGLFQEGYDGKQPWDRREENQNKQPWDTRKENQNTTPEAETAPEIEETANEEEWRMLKDNQLWEKRTPIKKIAKTQHTREKQNQTGQQRRG